MDAAMARSVSPGGCGRRAMSDTDDERPWLLWVRGDAETAEAVLRACRLAGVSAQATMLARGTVVGEDGDALLWAVDGDVGAETTLPPHLPVVLCGRGTAAGFDETRLWHSATAVPAPDLLRHAVAWGRLKRSAARHGAALSGLRAVLEALPLAAVVVVDGAIAFHNPLLGRVVGRESEDLSGEGLLDAFPDGCSELRAWLRDGAGRREPLRVRGKDGVVFEARGTPLIWDGETALVITLVRGVEAMHSGQEAATDTVVAQDVPGGHAGDRAGTTVPTVAAAEPRDDGAAADRALADDLEDTAAHTWLMVEGVWSPGATANWSWAQQAQGARRWRDDLWGVLTGLGATQVFRVGTRRLLARFDGRPSTASWRAACAGRPVHLDDVTAATPLLRGGALILDGSAAARAQALDAWRRDVLEQDWVMRESGHSDHQQRRDLAQITILIQSVLDGQAEPIHWVRHCVPLVGEDPGWRLVQAGWDAQMTTPPGDEAIRAARATGLWAAWQLAAARRLAWHLEHRDLGESHLILLDDAAWGDAAGVDSLMSGLLSQAGAVRQLVLACSETAVRSHTNTLTRWSGAYARAGGRFALFEGSGAVAGDPWWALRLLAAQVLVWQGGGDLDGEVEQHLKTGRDQGLVTVAVDIDQVGLLPRLFGAGVMYAAGDVHGAPARLTS